MKLEEFFKKWENKYIRSPAEDVFITHVFYKLLGENGLDYIEPAFKEEDKNKNVIILDYKLKTSYRKYDLEINGRTYHDIYSVSDSRYNELINRKSIVQDELKYRILEFTANDIKNNPIRAENQLRRGIMDDPELNPHFLEKKLNRAQKEFFAQILERHFDLLQKYVILAIPMGMGKTFISASEAIEIYKKCNGNNFKLLYLAHKNLILEQAYETYSYTFEDLINKSKLKLGFYNAYKKQRDSDILFATFQTMYTNDNYKRFNDDEFTFIIIDEFHHLPAESYSIVYKHFSKALYYLGLTATPYRSDNKNLFQFFGNVTPIYYDFKRGIQEGYLCPIKYYILDDNVDYSDIEFNGIRYKKADLDKKLVIEVRNEEILKEYKSKLQKKRTLGFCVNQKHAKRMNELFNNNGVPSKYIIAETSNSERQEIIKELKEDKIKVIFSIEIFNEGIDIPEVEALMFLRPTDSKLILLQQLGRGLRIAEKKEVVVILDFVGRNQMASFPAFFGITKEKIKDLEEKLKQSKEDYIIDKTEIGEVHFTIRSLETFKRIVEKTEGIDSNDLIENYFEVKEKIKGKIPSKEDMDKAEFSKYKYVEYKKKFGSWKRFLRLIKEIAISTDEVYPQGMHLFYVFYIIKKLGDKKEGDLLEKPLRPIDFYGKAEDINRQTRFRLRALMGMGLIASDLPNTKEENRKNKYQNLTELGRKFYEFINRYETIFPDNFWEIIIKEESKHAQFNWKSNRDDTYYYKFIKDEIKNKAPDFYIFLRQFFFEKLIPIKQLLRYIFQIRRTRSFSRNNIYENIYNQSFVREFNNRKGIVMESDASSRRRYAFPLNLLEVFEVVKIMGRDYYIEHFPLIDYLFLKIYEFNDLGDDLEELSDIYNPRLKLFKLFYEKYKDNVEMFIDVINKPENKKISEDLKELFGNEIFTSSNFFHKIINLDFKLDG